MDAALLLLLYLLGVETAFTPCFLPILPIFIGVVGRSGKGRIIVVTLFFVIGVTASFLFYGVLASYSSNVLQAILMNNLPAIAVGLGLTLISIGVIMLSPLKTMFSFIPSIQPRFGKVSALNALILGFSFTLIAAPCAATILVAAFSMVWLGSLHNPADSILTVLVYSMGVDTPFLLLGIGLQVLGKSVSAKLTRSFLVKYNEIISGVTIIILGVLTLVSVEGYDIIALHVARELFPYLSLLSLIASAFYAYESLRLGLKIGSTLPLLLGTGSLLIGLSDMFSIFHLILPNIELISMAIVLSGRILLTLGALLLSKPMLIALVPLPISPTLIADVLMTIAWMLGPMRRDKEHAFASLYLFIHPILDILQNNDIGITYLFVVIILPLCYLSPLLPALKFSKTLSGLEILEEL